MNHSILGPKPSLRLHTNNSEPNIPITALAPFPVLDFVVRSYK